MSNILKRLIRVAKSYIPHGTRISKEESEEIPFSFNQNNRNSKTRNFYSDSSSFTGNDQDNDYSQVPKQVVEDLSVFNLKPPSSLEEVRKARNREIKKYHSDKFVNDLERFQTSKEIMQIYNAAYDRLKDYYEKRASE